MTEFFEVVERDGPARLGELRLDEHVVTPAIADDVIIDGGSLWPTDRPTPAGRNDRVTIRPHRAFPSGTDQHVKTAFAVNDEAVPWPSGAVVSPTTADSCHADVYLLGGIAGLDGHPKAFCRAMIDLRSAIPDDTAVYLSGIATPANVSLLAWTGVDLVDTHRAVVKGTQGRYLTHDGECFLEDMLEYPCPCQVCRNADGHLSQSECVDHNVAALKAEITAVRERIRRGRLREYVEGQVRHVPWLTATLRSFDAQWSFVEERTPIYRAARIDATTDDVLRRIEVQRFADRVTTRYINRFSNPLVLVPCSATKPYSESKSHRKFRSAIDFRGHVVSLTSPLGVVPQELELTYPAQHYEAAVSGHWSEDERSFIAQVLGRYLDRNPYSTVVAHVPPGGYRDICEHVESARDIEFIYTVESHPTDEESLATLDEVLDGTLQYGKWERQRNTLCAIADYQFGDGAGSALFHDLAIQSRFPKLRAHDADGEQLAAMVPQYGTLALTLAGARRWLATDLESAIVEIDNFVPHGTVLAPGVIGADPMIRVGDEVVVTGPSAFAVGRAQMHGAAMTESSRGIAVDVRHVEELE